MEDPSSPSSNQFWPKSPVHISASIGTPPPPCGGDSFTNYGRVDDQTTSLSSTARKHDIYLLEYSNGGKKPTPSAGNKGSSVDAATSEPGPSLSSTATSPLSPWKNREIHLSNDILEFCNKYKTDPCDDSNSMHHFYQLWIKRRGFSEEDEDALREKMVELHQRFLINLQKLLSGGNIDDWMDPVEFNIYLLSYKIWGNDR